MQETKKHIKTSSLKIERTSSRSEHHDSYGFQIFRMNGYSIPKGMIGSFYAIKSEITTPYEKWDIRIEFSIQAPTGDASDFCHYTIPCSEWGQAKAIVDQWFAMWEPMIESVRQKEIDEYLYA
jgi:hypothetical protein